MRVMRVTCVSTHQHKARIDWEELILLEFQQVAINLVIHIGVVFLLTQV